MPVKGGNGMRQRGLADNAKELAGAAVSNMELRIVGRRQFLWEVISIGDDKKMIKRIPIHR